MKNTNKLLIVVGCIVLLIVSWVIVLGAKSDSAKQADLMAQATAYTDDGVYILAIPLLEEAAGYEAKHTLAAETALKEAYLKMTGQSGYRRKYIDLLNKQMSRKGATVDIFLEAANFYLGDNKLTEAYTVLKDGIAKTGSDELITLYEDNRYVYRKGYDYYEDVTAINGTTIGVSREGLWGLAYSDGELLIPCEYDKISTYSGDRAIVEKDGVISAVDEFNNRLALLKEKVSGFGNYSDGRVGLLTNEGWRRASGDFTMGSTVFEEIGTYSGGYAAAKQNGKWGVVDREDVWLIPAEHDGIVMDELGRCYAQGAAFVKKGNAVYLYASGKQVGDAYEDAKPFSDEGYAAVKKNGQWGFIDNLGELKIDYQFEDALSFGQHLAAIKIVERMMIEQDDTAQAEVVEQDSIDEQDESNETDEENEQSSLWGYVEREEQFEEVEYWGYINLYGKIVIEPIFLKAKSFAGGNAPVLTERGWIFLTLHEFKKGAAL